MELIVAPNRILLGSPSVFLAGGITDCPWWQDEVIEKLKDTDAFIYNPRRKNFPIDDPNAAKEQITWEFKALESCDIFTMWFCAGKSDQPICMYELGRNVALMEYSPENIVIGIEPGYRREQDVRIQVGLVDDTIVGLVDDTIANRISNNLDDHIANIKKAIEEYS